jgi:hypothetical protein
MAMPGEISQHLEDPDVIVIDNGDRSGRPVSVIETGEDGTEAWPAVPAPQLGASVGKAQLSDLASESVRWIRYATFRSLRSSWLGSSSGSALRAFWTPGGGCRNAPTWASGSAPPVLCHSPHRPPDHNPHPGCHHRPRQSRPPACPSPPATSAISRRRKPRGRFCSGPKRSRRETRWRRALSPRRVIPSYRQGPPRTVCHWDSERPTVGSMYERRPGAGYGRRLGS